MKKAFRFSTNLIFYLGGPTVQSRSQNPLGTASFNKDMAWHLFKDTPLNEAVLQLAFCSQGKTKNKDLRQLVACLPDYNISLGVTFAGSMGS